MEKTAIRTSRKSTNKIVIKVDKKHRFGYNLTMPETNFSLFFNQDQFRLIVWYKKINRILFKHGIFGLFALGAIAIIYNLTLYTTNLANLQENSSIHSSSSNEKLLRSLQSNQTKSSYLKVILPYGESALQDNNVIFSNQNIAFYQGIQVPKDFYITKGSSLIDKESFDRGEASSEEIERLVSRLIFTPSTITRKMNPHPTFRLEKGILTDFNLQCLDALKFSDNICFSFLNKLYEE